MTLNHPIILNNKGADHEAIHDSPYGALLRGRLTTVPGHDLKLPRSTTAGGLRRPFFVGPTGGSRKTAQPRGPRPRFKPPSVLARIDIRPPGGSSPSHHGSVTSIG